jgi:hypothetical protein
MEHLYLAEPEDDPFILGAPQFYPENKNGFASATPLTSLQFHERRLDTIGYVDIPRYFDIEYAIKNFVPNQGTLAQLRSKLKNILNEERMRVQETLFFNLLSTCSNQTQNAKKMKIWKELVTMMTEFEFSLSETQKKHIIHPQLITLLE